MTIYLHNRQKFRAFEYKDLSELQDALNKAQIYIGNDVQIGNDVHLGIRTQIFDNTIIRDGAKIGFSVLIHENVKIGKDVKIGNGSVIKQGVKLLNGVTIGKYSILHEGAEIGADIKLGDKQEIEKGTNLNRSIFIEGSKHQIQYLGAGKMSIGCVVNTIDWFIENYNQLGIDNDYSEAQRIEYSDKIKQVRDFYRKGLIKN